MRFVCRLLVVWERNLPVGLGDTLELVLLLDGVRVAGALGGVDELLGQALGDGLDVAEGGLAGAGGQQGDGLVDAAEGRHVDGLAPDGAGGADTGGVLAGSAVDDGVDGDLDGVLVGHEVDLWGMLAGLVMGTLACPWICVLVCKWAGTYDLKGVGDDADGHQLLAVVAAVGHQGVGQALDDGAVGLAEPLDGISAGGVRQVDGVADLDVVAAGRASC